MKIRLALGTVALVALALLLRFGDIPEGSTVLGREWNDSLEAGSAEEPAPPHGQESREATREPRSLGFAGGIPSDTTGSLLPRDFPADDPALVSRYYLYLPAGIESGRQWPLILYLHGRSLRGSNLSILTRYGLPARLQNDRSFPFVVVAPQLPGGQSWTDTGRLARLVEDVAARYPIDHTRIYLIGYSMGAGGVWRTAIDHPEMFAAARGFLDGAARIRGIA